MEFQIKCFILHYFLNDFEILRFPLKECFFPAYLDFFVSNVWLLQNNLKLDTDETKFMHDVWTLQCPCDLYD